VERTREAKKISQFMISGYQLGFQT
jgi:hypothetical protein